MPAVLRMLLSSGPCTGELPSAWVCTFVSVQSLAPWAPQIPLFVRGYLGKSKQHLSNIPAGGGKEIV